MFKLRVQYVKKGRLKYLSHLEVLRSVERIVRRAQLPYAISQGFSPRMRIAFSAASSVGLESYDEYFDLLLEEYVKPTEAYMRLSQAAPEDLMVRKAAYVPVKSPSLTAVLLLHSYKVSFKAQDLMLSDIQLACDEIEARGFVMTLKKGKAQTVKLAKKLADKPSLQEQNGRFELYLTTRATPEGSLRVDVYVEMLARLLHARLHPELQFDAFAEDELERKFREEYLGRVSYTRLQQEQEDEELKRYSAFERLGIEE